MSNAGRPLTLAFSLAELIKSTNLIILLEDEIFADFFNTFLSLPVFGQTPFYTVENSQWSLWPNIPYDLIVKYKGLLTWLEKYRLPFFCKTNLCFHYILCQELIGFVKSPEGAEMMRWKTADQWLLQKCTAGVRGMWRFCSYLKGSAGEELVDFWILAEKILSLDETDPEVEDHYLSLLLALKATHLQEGSRVATLCNVNIKSLLNLSIWHPTQSVSRRETLGHMQKVALFKLQSYWLPNFYTHAKAQLAQQEACRGLMQDYETRLCSFCCAHSGGLPLNMSIQKGPYAQRRYSSRHAKKKLWQLLDSGCWSLEMDLPPDAGPVPPWARPVPQAPSSKDRATDEELAYGWKASVRCRAAGHLHMAGLLETLCSSHLKTDTPIINHSSQTLTIRGAPGHSRSCGCTHWALCADACAGGPFRDFLKKLNLKVETQLLDLWQDLHSFLGVLTSSRRTGKAVFRHVLCNRICQLYLGEHSHPHLPLKPQTLQGLRELLPAGDVNPWIPRAQMEICQALSPWYEEFLNEEDYWFLNFTTQSRLVKSRWRKTESADGESSFLCRRLQEALLLSQALAHLEEMEAAEWQRLATEDLRQGGSLQVELSSPVFLADFSKMTFEELCSKNPKVAIEKISADYRAYCEKAPPKDFTMEIVREPKKAPAPRKLSFYRKAGLRKPSVRPRNLTEILLNPQHLDFFREFLKERKAESPLQFLVAVHKLSTETNEKLYKSSLENIIKTFFHGKLPPEEMLQCNVPILREITNMRRVSTTTLLMLQGHVTKSLEEKWLKEYQDLFPARPLETDVDMPSAPRKPSKVTTAATVTSTYLQDSQKRGWMKMVSFIKSFCKYRRFTADASRRQEFEDYLHLEMYNHKENFTSPNVTGRPTFLSPSTRSADQENGEPGLAKRRIFGHRIITINFAINDLYFFSEMEKFNELVNSAHKLYGSRAPSENDVVLLRNKASVVIKLFLSSDIPPKLRVNISEAQKDAVLAAFNEGHLDRSIFHGAIMSVFPVLMYFWKRFCSWKAVRSYLEYRGHRLKDRNPPKPSYKYPPWSGGDHAVLRFSLLRGVEWLRPQQREVTSSPAQNSSSSNLTQMRLVLSSGQLCSVPG
ncbi:regulator of G-protein signaling protein-like [Ochotona curzoniae]|uniref:regulator of G-protein signaling protein-like n=1 Tax=Ochotona curzoniae TaxID=130825 RepID=UPI001B34CA51|nr:regulator of G-protein signaling protein-like [Ochotona curzoniae]